MITGTVNVNKMHESFFSMLEKAVSSVPVFIYWKDKNSIFLGANKLSLQLIGYETNAELFGKTDYDLWPKFAEKYVADDKEVVATGKTISKEDIFPGKSGEIRYCIVTKTPIRDEQGNIIGILGVSIDITDRKEKERLQIENEQQKIVIKIADQVSHDIRSPARTIHDLINSRAEDIPEDLRIILRETAANIIDVANSLISRYGKGSAVFDQEEPQPIIASLSLMQILSEKRIQNAGSLIKFTEDYTHDSMLVFIKVQPSHYKRMISNLLNNAIEAMENKKGIVHLDLSIDEVKKDVKIIIQDSGKGMSEETINKIKVGTTVATDKKEGHGIGLTQIRETIERNKGQFDIVSKLGEGTKVILTFPIAIPPQWLAKDIKINKGDTVVILDDDPAIHSIWDMYFQKHKNDIQLKHFILGKEAINFINTFPEKNKLYLLTDQELMKQDGLTGIDVIKQTNLERTTLVTSHYAEIETQKLAAATGTGILPKDLATAASIEICDAKQCSPIETKKATIVIADDSEMLCNTVVEFVQGRNQVADKYCDPNNFLNNVSKYAKDTIMLVDHEFNGSELSGFDVLKKLHEQGFTRLYLFSGREFEKSELPNYLSVIMKTDIDALMKVLER